MSGSNRKKDQSCQDMVDALREMMGLSPLYATRERQRTYGGVNSVQDHNLKDGQSFYGVLAQKASYNPW